MTKRIIHTRGDYKWMTQSKQLNKNIRLKI